MKKGKLYKVNEHNIGGLLSDRDVNIFSGMQPGTSWMNNFYKDFSDIGSPSGYMSTSVSGGQVLYPGKGGLDINLMNMASNISNYSTVNTPSLNNDKWLKVGKTGTTGATSKLSSLVNSNIGKIGIGIAGSVANKAFKGALSGGMDNKVGNAVADIGGQVGGIVGNFNPVLGGIISAGTGLIGGAINGLWGSKFNEENIADIENNIATTRMLSDAVASSNTNADLLDKWAKVNMGYQFNKDYIGKEGIWSNKVTRKYNKLTAMQNAAAAYALHNLGIGAKNTDRTTDDIAFYNSKPYAFGGPLDNILNNDNMGATEYGLALDYLDNYRNKKNNSSNDISTNMFAGVPSTMFKEGGEIHIKHPGRLTALKERTGKTEAELYNDGNPDHKKMVVFARNARKWKHADGGPISIFSDEPSLFAIGGDLQTNGADFTNGLTHVNSGLSHELNPNEGVQVGIDSQGTPNLVEEGETIFNDYVYSNRIECDDKTKERFRISKKRNITFADLSRTLEKESVERPNDPISLAALEIQMEELANQQERQKAEMEAKRAKEAFEALSPEEQAAIMQQAAQQEQAMAQQQVMQQQPVALEDAAMIEQAPQEEMSQQPVMACGGKVNRYDKGGILKLLNSLGYKTVADAEKAGWTPSDFGNFDNWNDINASTKLPDNFKWNDEFTKRISSPELKAAISLGWSPVANLLGKKWYEGDNGNHVGWTESYGKDRLNAEEFKDYAKRYKNTLGWAVDNNIISAPKGNESISMKDIVSAMVQAPDWKATDDWLYSDIANQAAYLGMARGLNPDNDTKFINKWSPYGTFSRGEDGNWNYTLRDNLSNAEKEAFTSLFKKARTDNKVGVMYNNFHDPDTVTNKYVLDDDGNVTMLTSDDLSDYEQLGRYSWGDEPNDINKNAIFYRLKNTPGAAEVSTEKPVNSTATETDEVSDEEDIKPVLKKEWPRYAGIVGPAINLGLMAAGVGKPDYSELNKAVDMANRSTALATYQPIGDYIRYSPLDIWAEQNRADANARATDRAIINNNGSLGTKMAGLLASNYNDQLGRGAIFRQSQEYNDNLKKQAAEFNRGTNQFNANAFNNVSTTNAQLLNRDKQFRSQMGMMAAREKLEGDASWYNSLYGNLNSIYSGLSNLGKENVQHNMIARMAADGLFENMTPDTYIAKGYLSSKEGGKIKRKKK